MTSSFDIWKVLAGVAIFLLGIRFLEESLGQLSSRKFKLFLKKQTSSKIRGIAGGAVITGILQSSSLVSLMVLAFVGAGVITMQNALAVILGANLGTTLDSWIVALVGFKLSIENIALPVAGIAGLGYAVFNKQSRWYNWSRFFLGFSFLFVGLGYMKSGVEALVVNLDLKQFDQAPLLAFFGIGFAITALIQSSSATIAITLSALSAGALSLTDAMAIVLGSEIGTTIKLFLASIKGMAAKRRVALGNFMFNTINVSLVLIFLFPLQRLITGVIGIKDNLLALVFFQSLVNIIGILLFYPLLNVFGRFLEKRYQEEGEETLFIHKVTTTDPSLALFAMEKENRHFLHAALDFTWTSFKTENSHARSMELHQGFTEKDPAAKYEYIKFLYGEIHSFYIRLQGNSYDKEDAEKLDRLIASVRNTMYAAKSIKDALPDMEQLRNSANDVKYGFYQQTRQTADGFCQQLYTLLEEKNNPTIDRLTTIYAAVTSNYTSSLQHLYKESVTGHVGEVEITTLLNFNREVVTGFKSLVVAVKDYLFDKEESRLFDELPGFIR